MTEALFDPLDVALAIAAAFDEHDIPYAIGGALALGVWAIPRATMDVDVNVFVEGDELASVVSVFLSLGVTMEESSVIADATRDGMFQCYWGDIRVDVFTPSIEFSWEAEKTRRLEEIEGQRIYFLSPEALAVFKLLFFRRKDLADLERLIGVQGSQLDVAYVRARIVEMMGEADPRVAEWDALCAQSPPG